MERRAIGRNDYAIHADLGFYRRDAGTAAPAGRLSMNRSYLYAPGSRPDLMAKALTAGADAVVFDLEDAVDATVKPAARRAVAALLTIAPGATGEHPVPAAATELAGRAARAGITAAGSRPALDGPQRHVRIGRVPGGFDLADLRAVAGPLLAAVRLPKCVDPGEVVEVGAALDELGHPDVRLYLTIESAAGVLRAGELAAAHPRVSRLCFGASDFLADIGAPGVAHGPATDTARGLLVLHSRAGGLAPPVDSVHTAVADLTGLRDAARHARQLGFFGKSVIHPRQLAVVHEVFTPSRAERERAARIVAAFEAASQRRSAALTVDGEFVDPAVVARARALLALPDGEHLAPSGAMSPGGGSVSLVRPSDQSFL